MKSSVVVSDPEVMGGTPCFAGTRVPVENLFDHICGGESLDEFLEGFPSVSRAQAVQVLMEAQNRILDQSRSEAVAR